MFVSAEAIYYNYVFYIKMVRKTFRHLKLGVNQLDETRDM